MSSKPLPQNIEAEQAVLGSILMDSGTINEVLEILTAEDFYRTSHQLIYRAMNQMQSEKKPIDLLCLYKFIEAQGNLDDVGGSSYITCLPEMCPSPVNAGYYAKLVKEKVNVRRLSITCMDVDQKLKNGQMSYVEACEIFQYELENGSHSTVDSLKPISAIDLGEAEPVESLWGDILFPECITQLNSEPGIGKTTFAYNLCIFGALGLDFLDVGFSHLIKTLYFDLETPRWRRASKVRTICTNNVPPNLFFCTELSFLSSFHDLLRLCKRDKYDIVVFDTQSRVFGMEQENDNSEANRVMALLRQLVNETRCAVVLIHHTNKSEKKGVYSGRGASAIAGAVDVVVNMESLDEEVIKLTVAKNRVVGTNPTLYMKKVGEDQFEPYIHPDEGSSGFEVFRAQKLILSQSPERIWETKEFNELGVQEGIGQKTVQRAINKSVELGKLNRVKRGHYRIRDIRDSPIPDSNVLNVPKDDLPDTDPWCDTNIVAQEDLCGNTERED